MTVLAIAVVLFFQWRRLSVKNVFIIMSVLLILTAVFDSLIIALGLVTYDTAKILGVYIGKAPIEDFSYTIVAAIIVPLLWERGAKK